MVMNNAKVLNRLDFKVVFIGVNRESTRSEIDSFPILNYFGRGGPVS